MATSFPGSKPALSIPAITASSRSEEHTSELQSPCNLVCRLLLEKKKMERVQCFGQLNGQDRDSGRITPSKIRLETPQLGSQKILLNAAPLRTVWCIFVIAGLVPI